MSSGINFSGLSSGIDTNSIITQLIAIERQPETLLKNQQTDQNKKFSIYQDLNTQLLTVKTSAEALSKTTDFDKYTATSSNPDAVGVSITGVATPGTFSVEALSLATAQTRSSKSFSSNTDALGLSGNIVINGKAIAIGSANSLQDIHDAIVNADAGVTAQVLRVSDTDYRLLLSSQTTGAQGFSLLDASSSDVLQGLGFTNGTTTIKNAVSGGAQTDQFTSATSSISSLLGLNGTLSGTVTIGDKTVSLDLSTQSLQDIKDAIDAAAPTGVTTSIVSSQDSNGNTTFRLQINGTKSFTDSNNVLEALGVLQGSSAVDPAVAEVQTADVANTTDGTTAVDANTKFDAIFGANVANGDTISISGTDRSGNAVSGTFTISNTSSDKLQGLLDQVRSVFGNSVTASIDSTGHIVVSDDTAGASQLSVTLKANNEGGGALDLGAFSVTTEGADSASREITAGQDASFRINGVSLTRSSNSITDAIDGLTINLNSITASAGRTATIQIAQDTSAIRQNIQTLVSNFNDAMSKINDQFVYNQDTQTAGPLAGDATLLAMQSQLRSVITTPIAGLPDGQNALSLFGVSFDRQGQLQIDSAKLDSTLSSNMSALRKILTANGSTSDSDISFVYQGDNTKPGTYDVNITTAAEQASTTGTADLTGGLSAAEHLTLTDKLTQKSDTIAFNAGDTIDTIVSKINNTLSSSVAEERTGSVANTTDGTTPISGTTTFADIAGAGVAAGDTIGIQGTMHSGERVSGTFTISDPATQTVNDLLTQIRGVFGGTVSASINSDGKLVISDSQVGTSNLTMALIEHNEGGGSLNFGSIDQTSQGRYAIDAVAENDGGKLKLTSSSYGASSGFTVSQDTGELGLTDGSYAGVDVAGTINGEAATGSGRVLTGSSSSSAIAGVAVRVSLTPTQLTAQGSSQGTVTVTQGVADQLRRTLASITDPLQGMIASREKSIQDTVKAAQDQIDAMEQRITIKQQTLQQQFTAMETAVSQYNSLGSFLGSQLASLSTGTK